MFCFPGARQNLATAKKNAIKALRSKQYEWASKWYSEAIELEPNDVKLYTMRSTCFLALGKYVQCVGDGDQMIRLKPKLWTGYHRKAQGHAKLGEFAHAHRAVLFGLGVDPSNTQLLDLQKDVDAQLASGVATAPTSSALLFAHYDEPSNVQRGDTQRPSLVGAESDMPATYADFELMLGVFRQRLVSIYGRHLERYESGSRDSYLARLRAFFDQEPAQSFYYLYYTGRASADTGDWCICAPRLGLDEIVEMWQISAGHAAASRLVIIADCNYSGAWVDRLNREPRFASLRNVAMQAACGADELARTTAAGGLFTTTWASGLAMDTDLAVLRVAVPPRASAGLDAVRQGRYADDDTRRPLLALSAWVPQLADLTSLADARQVPCARARWALADEMVLHCGRRFALFNCKQALELRRVHELDLAETDTAAAADAAACRVS